MNQDRFLQMVFSIICGVVTTLSPTLPYILLCTAIVLMDCITSWRLGRRVRKTHPHKTTKNTPKFNSKHFGDVIQTLMVVYAVLIFAFFLHVYVTDSLPFNALKVSAGLIIGWEIWSCLENESSCNGKKWAIILQQIMVDKTERHFDVNLSVLKKEK